MPNPIKTLENRIRNRLAGSLPVVVNVHEVRPGPNNLHQLVVFAGIRTEGYQIYLNYPKSDRFQALEDLVADVVNRLIKDRT